MQQKTYTLIAVFFHAIVMALAQTPSANHVFTASIGAALPISEFRSVDTSANAFSGFSQTGVSFQMSYCHSLFNKNSGAIVKGLYTRNNLHRSSLETAFNSGLANNEWSVISTSSWETANLLAGIYISLKAWNIYIEPHILGGYAYIVSPEVILNYYDHTYYRNTFYYLPSFSSWNKVLLTGLAFRYNIKKNTFGINSEYYYSKAIFADAFKKNNSGYRLNNSLVQPIQQMIIEGSWGIAF